MEHRLISFQIHVPFYYASIYYVRIISLAWRKHWNKNNSGKDTAYNSESSWQNGSNLFFQCSYLFMISRMFVS